MRSTLVLTVLGLLINNFSSAQDSGSVQKVMDGFPPSRESLVTGANYREHPYSQWSFRNAGATQTTLMIPRSGKVHQFRESGDLEIGRLITKDTEGISKTFEAIFSENFADGVLVVRNNTVLYEKYWNGLTRDQHHIWFSCSKSLASAAFGILIQERKIDLSASPARYIPELSGTAFERVTIQDVLNMSTALGFQESYGDTSNFFYKYYTAAANAPGARISKEADPKTAEVLGVYDFLVKKAYANDQLPPGEKFEYSSVNVDVISWLISRLSGQAYHEYLYDKIWSKIGAEHDAFITADRAHVGIATGGINSTLRDFALFGQLILNRGNIDGKQIVPASWIDETTKLSAKDKERYNRNDVYVKANMPWVAYKNYWWILDETKGEYAAVGIHGQVLYINRSANLVVAYYSSQPQASSIASFKPFVSKLNACRELANMGTK